MNISEGKELTLTNYARVCGIAQKPEFDHESFFTVYINVGRQSGTIDHLPITISKRLLTDIEVEGEEVLVEGEVRTYNKIGDDGRTHLHVRLFAKDIWPVKITNENFVTLTGFVCKPTAFRTTPFGREICDVMLAVNRKFGKSDYIPCITWRRTARFTASLPVGTCVKIEGRLQSRNYENTLGERREVYEVSAYHLQALLAE